jgi:NADH-quinone oxidoreductase subunit L
MVWPVLGLAALSLVGGFLQVPGLWHTVDDWLHPVAESIEESSGATAWFSALAAFALAAAGILLAWRLYGGPSEAPAKMRRRFPWAARTLEKKFYFDEAYQLAFYEPSSRLATAEHRFLEEPLLLRPLGDLGRGVRVVSSHVAAAQTGLVRSYALALAAGAAVIAVVFLFAT